MSDTINNTADDDEVISLVYSQDEDGEHPRLDQFLSDQITGLSRARVKKLIDCQKVSVNGEYEKASLKLKGGEAIEVKIPPLAPSELVAEDLNLDVVFEDENLIVVNKPVGMVTHPGAGVYSGTLVNGLLFHCQGSLSGISGEERPGIVHRLDKDTSGLLVVAKNDYSHHSLAEQIARKTARRKYLALTQGLVRDDEGVIDQPIGRHPKRRKEMAIVEGGRRATTIYKVRSRFHHTSLLDLELKTGRTHQIRVHLAFLGFPIVGDLIYNKKGSGTEKARKKYGLSGQALHATSLSFRHPESDELLEFTAEPPEEFGLLIERLTKQLR